MPYKTILCGIYMIETPNGSRYVGSSKNIYHRWSNHKLLLRKKTHRNVRLQDAWDKYSGNLSFSVLLLCDEDDLIKNEQFFIDKYDARLNITEARVNSWSVPESRKKLMATISTAEYKARIHKVRMDAGHRVVCSNGQKFRSMAAAGRAFGLKTSGVRALVKSGRPHGRLGVRFRLERDEWREVITAREATSIANTGRKHSSEARKKMRVAAKGRKPSALAITTAAAANSKPVVGVSVDDGTEIVFPSARSAVRYLGRSLGGSAFISRCISGKKPTAYGYRWRYG